jgi:hypothetical protein
MYSCYCCYCSAAVATVRLLLRTMHTQNPSRTLLLCSLSMYRTSRSTSYNGYKLLPPATVPASNLCSWPYPPSYKLQRFRNVSVAAGYKLQQQTREIRENRNFDVLYLLWLTGVQDMRNTSAETNFIDSSSYMPAPVGGTVARGSAQPLLQACVRACVPFLFAPNERSVPTDCENLGKQGRVIDASFQPAATPCLLLNCSSGT